MSVELNEKTEITVPLKTLISIISAIVVASWYVFTTQNKIKDIEHNVKIADERFTHYINQPGKNSVDIELMKKEFDYLKKEISDLKQRTK
jgi:hypothetical protein